MIGGPIGYLIGYPNREGYRPRIGVGRIPRPDPTRYRYPLRCLVVGDGPIPNSRYLGARRHLGIGGQR